MTEAQIQSAILRTFATRTDMRLWRNNSGVARGRNRIVRFGIAGQADLSGILPDGRRLEIEVKGPDGRQSLEQLNFQVMIRRFNGVYVVARSVDDVWQAIGPILEKSHG